MTIYSRLFRPLDYLRVRHSEKIKYDLYLPLILSFLLTVVLLLLPKPVHIFGSSGLIKIITEILQILTGFYIASLAVISTFKKEGMDDVMPGKPMMLKVKIAGVFRDEELTRRRLLCLLFGYLALISIFLYFLGAGSNLLIENIKYLIPIKAHGYVKWSFIFLYLLVVSNLLITTLIGLFYMVDRIHRIDPKLLSPDETRELHEHKDDE